MELSNVCQIRTTDLLKKLALTFTLTLLCLNSFSQDPDQVEGRWNAGPSWSACNSLSSRTTMGTTVRYATIQSSVTNGSCDFLFIDDCGDYDPKWGGGSSRASNTFHSNGGVQGGADNNFSSTSGNYYTFIIENVNGYTNADISILTIGSDDPTGISIDAVNQTPASPDCSGSVTVEADLDIALRGSEYLWLAYTTDNWSSASFVQYSSFDGDNKADATIPTQANGTTVKYYVFSSPLNSMAGVTATTAPYLGVIWSAEGSYTVSQAISISAQPWADNTCAGENASFSVTASNVSSYQWQESDDNGASWSNLSDAGIYSGTGTATLTLTGVTSGMNGYDYRAVLSSGSCDDVNSNSANLGVTYSTFSVHPSDQIMGSGGSITFTATADNSPSYQWQESTDNGSSWSNVSNGGVYSNVTTNTISISAPGLGYDTYDYRVVATPSGCSAGTNSNSANLSVNRGTSGGGDGTWNDPSHWNEGSVPPSGADVVLDHYTVLDQDATVASLVIQSSGTLTEDGGGRRLSIQSGGSLTNEGAYTANAETIDFEGNGTIDGGTSTTFNNLELNGTLTVTTVPTINGTLQLNSSGTLSASPNYGTSSTLLYNSGGTYGRNVEWDDDDQSNPGYPHHVTIANNTTLNQKNGTNGTRYVGGNLTIEAGSKLDMQDNTAPLIVEGNIDIANTAELELSSAGGGNIEIYGNWTNNGTYTHNSRSINFKGTQDPQIITETAGEDWQYFHIDKSSGNVQLATDLTISNTWGDNLVFDDAGGLDLNDNTLTLADGANIDQNYVGTVTISNSGGSGTGKIVFPNQTTFTGVNGSREFSFGTGITLEFNNMVTGLNQTTINGTVDVKTSGSFSGSGPVWGSTSTLTMDTSDDEYYSSWSNIWSEGALYDWTIASGTTFRLDSDGTISSSGTVTVNGSIVIHDGSANRDMDWNGDFIIGATGTLNMNNTVGADMFLAGDFTCISGGTFTMDERMMEFDGNGTQTVSGDFGGQKWHYVNINNSHATEGVELDCDVTIDYQLRFIDGYLFTKDNYLIFDGTSAYCDGAGDCNDGDGDTDSHIVCDGEGGVSVEDFSGFDTWTFPIASAPGEYDVNKGVYVDDDNNNISSGTMTVGLNTDMTMGGDDDAILNPDNFVQTLYYFAHSAGVGDGVQITMYWNTSDEGGSFTRASAEMYHLDGTDEWVDENATTGGSGSYYYVQKTVTSFSPFAVGDDSPAILPVELGAYVAYQTPEGNQIDWTTYSENNNSHFVVERSADGINFEMIGTVDGGGTSATGFDYYFVDYSTAEGNVYYRIIQVDYDGQQTFYEKLFIPETRAKSILIWPNPVRTGQMGYYQIKGIESDTKVEVLNAIGQQIWVDAGTISYDGALALPYLMPGSYFLRTTSFTGTETKRFQVVR